MKIDLGAYFGDDGQRQPQPQQRPQQAPPGNLMGLLNSMAAQIRQLQARVAQLEGAIPALSANDKKTADYVNQLGDMVKGVDAQTRSAVAALRAFARGGGVQPAQFVPKASDAVVAYETPGRGQQSAEPVDPGAGGGPEPTISYEEALFHGLDEEDD